MFHGVDITLKAALLGNGTKSFKSLSHLHGILPVSHKEGNASRNDRGIPMAARSAEDNGLTYPYPEDNWTARREGRNTLGLLGRILRRAKRRVEGRGRDWGSVHVRES